MFAQIRITWSPCREFRHARRDLEAGCFYSLSSLDGCLTFRIVLSSWHCLESFLIERLATMGAAAISTVFNSAQRFINFFDELRLTAAESKSSRSIEVQL